MKKKYVFKRNELKYVITPEIMRLLIDKFSKFVEPDEYGETTVYSLYYDTPDKRIIRKSVEKPPFKEKLRVRKYGSKKGGNVFIELKRKVDGVVYKRRIELLEKTAFDYLSGKPVDFDGQIKREIDYFISFYKNLQPSTMISCERIAFKNDETELRITFDKNIRYRTCDFEFKNSNNDVLITDNSVLMEIKTPYAIPLEIVKILSDLKLYKRSFSKYGTAHLKELNLNLKGDENVG